MIGESHCYLALLKARELTHNFVYSGGGGGGNTAEIMLKTSGATIIKLIAQFPGASDMCTHNTNFTIEILTLSVRTQYDTPTNSPCCRALSR